MCFLAPSHTAAVNVMQTIAGVTCCNRGPHNVEEHLGHPVRHGLGHVEGGSTAEFLELGRIYFILGWIREQALHSRFCVPWNRYVILCIYDFGHTNGMDNVLFAYWELKGKGPARLIDKMWFQKIVTKILINIRYRLNQLIDQNTPKPPELVFEQWNDLIAMRATKLAKKKSAHMHGISNRKTAKASQLHSLHVEVLVRLVSHSSCMFFHC